MPSPLQQLRQSREWRSLALFLYTCGAVIFLNDNVLETTSITGSSMSPTLSPDYHATKREDFVLWKKWNPTANLQRGDIIHFCTPHKRDGLAVKRVIALEGDMVELDKRRRPFRREGPEPVEARAWDGWGGRVKVPQGHIWVEGDAVGNSTDSNDYGPLSKSLITGAAVAVVWPPSRFGTQCLKGFHSKTKVVRAVKVDDWRDGLPIELREIVDPHLPR